MLCRGGGRMVCPRSGFRASGQLRRLATFRVSRECDISLQSPNSSLGSVRVSAGLKQTASSHVPFTELESILDSVIPQPYDHATSIAPRSMKAFQSFFDTHEGAAFVNLDFKLKTWPNTDLIPWSYHFKLIRSNTNDIEAKHSVLILCHGLILEIWEPWELLNQGSPLEPSGPNSDRFTHFLDRFTANNSGFSEIIDIAKRTSLSLRSIKGDDRRVMADRLCSETLEAINEKIYPRRLDSLTAVVSDGRLTPAKHTAIGQVAVTYRGRAIGRAYRPQASKKHRALIALGSNLGDRIDHINKALDMMQENGLQLKGVSPLYETDPMYVTEQATFLNGVCEIETDLEPLPLLDVLQTLEKELGRVREVEKGPRTVDLDVILYDYLHLDHERLQIPHPLMWEREFVLRPLCDLIPSERLPPPFDNSSISQLVANTARQTPGRRPSRVTALGDKGLLTPGNPMRPTCLMAILNLTPDSFSDGNVHSVTDFQTLEHTVLSFIESGATIIDIGGQSTRPHATLVSSEEEARRILPAIQCIRAMPEARKVAISVDTFYANVAEEAVAAGADIINDVTGGTFDPQMLRTVARLKKTIILMHMRGTPETMNQLTQYPDGLLETVGRELADRVEAAKAAGIHPWHIILDPGIGFAKTDVQNLELLSRLDSLRLSDRLRGYPWLVGPSRKGFIGRITGVKQASQRGWGTAAAVTASISGGADIVRVHDVAEIGPVVKMADAIYRVEHDPLEETAHPAEDSLGHDSGFSLSP